MAGSTDVPDETTTGTGTTDLWTSWKSLPLPRRVIAPVIGGVAAGVGRELLDGGDRSVGRFIFHAVWWAVMLPVLWWSGARRRNS